MSIAPASDFLFDMVRVADPARARDALARLAGDEAASFASVLDATGSSSPRLASAFDIAQASARSGPKGPTKMSPEAELEAFFLQNFVELILPKEESLFGGGLAGESWRSMMAEHMARGLAASGGLGLAGQLAKSMQNRSEAGAA